MCGRMLRTEIDCIVPDFSSLKLIFIVLRFLVDISSLVDVAGPG